MPDNEILLTEQIYLYNEIVATTQLQLGPLTSNTYIEYSKRTKRQIYGVYQKFKLYRCNSKV